MPHARYAQEMSQQHTIQTIMTALNETEERPRGQIAAIVRALGEETALAVLVEANEVERLGGMMLPDGSRRRTPGGVFFTLARRRLSPEDREAIFPKSPQPLLQKNGAATENLAPSGPERRHVRLIGSVESSPHRAIGVHASSNAPAQSFENRTAGSEAQNESNGAAARPEVKLVRLDRRRIVPLPPLPPKPEQAEPVRTRRIVTPRGIDAKAEPVEKATGPMPPAEPRPNTRAKRGRKAALVDAHWERLQIKRQISELLTNLEVEQQRLVLLDLLSAISGEPLADEASAKQPETMADLRERILAAVGNRLEIPVGQLAATIYGTDTPANRRRVRTLSSKPPE